ncbi:SacI homology domain-containing protein [Pavlovales sp. CCMP2436]|nr:SacI homology domain-containing protein [Pavlovales sp. CCMP2436]
MLVINRKRAARASGYEIWQATGFEVIALGEPHKLPGRVLREERELVRGVKKHILGCRCLYLSYEHDITHTAQRIATRVQRAQPLWRRAEPRFFFNRHAVEPLISACADRWVLPLLLGFVHHHEGVLNGRAFDVLTIARRSSRRAGVRFHQRGLGGSGCGEVAHLVESEQVLLCMGRLQSHVQLRGSIPLTWWQPPQLMVADPHRSIVLAEGKAGVAGCAAHVSWLLDEYGPELSVVSLVNESKGAEIALGHALARELTRMGEALVTYVPFDFHAVCSGGRLERISLLLEQLGEALGRHGAFEQELQPTGAPPLPPRAGSANTLALPEAQHTLSAFPPRSGSANSLAASHDGRMAERTATERAAKSRARTAPPSPPASTAGMEEKGEGEEPPPTAVGTAAAACAVGKLPLWTNFSLLPPARLRDGCARGRILSVQFGVVRTNCVDCQDRTNVAQAEVGMLVLQAQLRHAKVQTSTSRYKHQLTGTNNN